MATKISKLLPVLNEYFPIEINRAILEQYLMLMYTWETRQKHPNALNSPLLGVDPIFFTSQDTRNLFDIFDIEQSEFRNTLKKCQSSVFDMSRKVSTDSYNILTMWAIHRTFHTQYLKEDEKYMLMMAFLKMMHYKFFTSLVNHNYKYGANEAIMQATINGLSEKFDLIKYGTWKAVMEARCEDILARDSIHYDTIDKFDDDYKIVYIITDAQTRLRNKVKIINNEYHAAKARGDTISSHKLSTEIDGEKLIVDQVSVLDTMTTNISNQLLNINQWIDNQYIKTCSALFGNISESMMKQFLTSFSNYASLQTRRKEMDKTVKEGDRTLYIGSRILIKTLLQKNYRMCIQARINLKNKANILVKVKNIYAASRVTDPFITDVKETIFKIIDECMHIQREATKASLRIAFICYVMLKSFEYL